MITRTAEYALRALLVLAREQGAGAIASDRIAAATGMPANYTSKTLYRLSKAGLVASTRGPAGGFTLARPASAISLADITDLFAERPSTDRCLLGNRLCDPTAPCTAHDRWTSLKGTMRAALATTTLTDLLSQASSNSGTRAARGLHASGTTGAL